MDNLPRPKVSICVPTYNRAHLVDAAIESALAQDFDDELEVIVSDNCSTDNTAQVVARFEGPNLCYSCSDRNHGWVANLNRCLSLARGEYALILYDDDVLNPNGQGTCSLA